MKPIAAMLVLLCMFSGQTESSEPHRRSLEIYINSRESHSAAIHQQLTTDWLARAAELDVPAETVLEYEATRRRIHRHFRITFREYSGLPAFRFARGETLRIPQHKGRDPRELPGYLEFFDWLANELYADYYEQLRQKENSARWAYWNTLKVKRIEDFIAQQKKLGYTPEGFYYYFDFDYDEGFIELPQFRRDKITYTAEERGWKEPAFPVIVPVIEGKPCPLDPEWKIK